MAISPTGVSTAFIYPTQTSAGPGFSSLFAAIPPSVNPPIFFEPSPVFTAGEPKLLIIVTGLAPTWGGAQVYGSVDNTTYGLLGTVSFGGVQGVVTADFPVGSDPDITHTLSVNVSMSGNQITAVSDTSANLGVSLAYVGAVGGSSFELVGYSAATLVSTSNYNLGTYLRRGMFDSGISDHPSGSPFGLVGSTVFSYVLNPIMVGSTLYFKFPSFNLLGGQLQDLSSITEYSYTVTGTGIMGVSRLPIRRVAQGGGYTLLVASDYLLEVINGTLATTAVAGPSGTLPVGLRFQIKDKVGNVDAYPITFTPAGGQTIDGLSSYSISSPWGSAVFTWDGIEWAVG
jgi:hypothetical protein